MEIHPFGCSIIYFFLDILESAPKGKPGKALIPKNLYSTLKQILL